MARGVESALRLSTDDMQTTAICIGMASLFYAPGWQGIDLALSWLHEAVASPDGSLVPAKGAK